MSTCFIIFCSVFVFVSLAPNKENQPNVSRDGIGDLFNPPNIIENVANQIPGNSPIQGIGDIFNQTNSKNSSFLDKVKLFLVTVQGVVMPASTITSGFSNLVQGLGNVGNIFQNFGQNLNITMIPQT
ncbi:uncharacterized protein LOC132706862 [Cylas formicarius]|uniref:uncharacterized protein LOC132706862 n=1 Tax=Cylas formicarius TaxID=197179 RepID=UPI002958C1FE|nr:uncharacterized protein LOC132706862 [Cylas formicarius]